jgi:hypothetical protein
MDIEEFYDENPARRASEEFEYGRGWSDASGARWELSWVEATGELYAMAEPVEPIVSDMFGDVNLQAMPTKLVTVEVLGVVAPRTEVERLLWGWTSVMSSSGSMAWVRERVAHGPDTLLAQDAGAQDMPFEVSGDDDGSSVIISTAIGAFREHLPTSEISKLASYQAKADLAGADPAAEWHRAYACARWADQIVAIPEHSHLAAHAKEALEIVREVGVTLGAELRDFGYLPLGKAVSPRFQTELAWVYEAVHVAQKVAEKNGWDAVPWEPLLEEMLAIP